MVSEKQDSDRLSSLLQRKEREEERRQERERETLCRKSKNVQATDYLALLGVHKLLNNLLAESATRHLLTPTERDHSHQCTLIIGSTEDGTLGP